MRQLRYSVAMSLDGFIAGAEGRVRLDRPRSGVRLRRAVSPVRHAPDGASDLRSRAVPGPVTQEHEDEDGRGFDHPQCRAA
jgi:hypothetical protein